MNEQKSYAYMTMVHLEVEAPVLNPSGASWKKIEGGLKVNGVGKKATNS